MKLKDKTKNQVNVIYPYRTKHGVWCFDDAEVGLQVEPFVGNINLMIDSFAQGKETLKVFVSSSPMPEPTLILDKCEEGMEGTYKLRGTDMEGWLCPATHKYMNPYPETIHVIIE